MKLLLTGLSHKTAPVDLRERLAIAESALPRVLRDLQELGAAEAVVLSTCNRVEFAVSTPDDVEPNIVLDQFLTQWEVPRAAFDGHMYRLEARDAIQHIFRVAASLDSMVVGEPQILGQLKAAYSVAKTEGCVGGMLESVLTRAFSAAKRVRSETGIGQMAVSVSYAAVELARQIFGSLKAQRVLIIGSGKMGELAAKHLRRSGANKIFVTNRTHARAEEMARLFEGRAIDYSAFPAMLHEIDIVIASSGAPHFILTRDEMHRVISLRKNKPMFLIDIAVPRNIEPTVNDIDGVFLYDVDDLAGVVNENLKEREKQAAAAENIIAEEVENMMGRLRIEGVTPTIVSLREQLEEIRAGEVAKAVRGMQGLTPEMERKIEALTHAIINKVAHGPISELRRNATEPEGDQAIEVIRKVFHLQR
jgi:glutamyl-tRNA reductase